VRPSLRAQVLREWCPYTGEPPAPDIVPTGKLVPKVLKGFGLEQRLQESRVFSLWANIVGADIAKHAQPVSMKKGRLEVIVDHPIWLNELSRYHKPMMLQKIQAVVGKQAVRDLVFRIG
jgi:predicted nucleic acid-binding Zn ribbon protein